MVHARYNEKEINPNPAINFITSLPDEPTRQEDSRQLLRALAAQVKPVMKQHGLEVNSLEEYEYNAVFAGRNWNNGERIELVLRKPDGSFYPTYWLMSTLCHELAHNKHMNHGPAFQALWSRLRTEVRQLQASGYYGDGFWSFGTRLRDLARIGGDGIEDHEMPEYVCGGAHTRSRPTANRRRVHRGARGKRREIVPSLHTGAQTAKKRKAGSRVTSGHPFIGKGVALSMSDGGSTGPGFGFGKRANSKRAREERALAADQRLLALRCKSQDRLQASPLIDDPPTNASTSGEQLASVVEDDGSGADSDDEVEVIAETDPDRRQALLDSEQSNSGLQKLTTKDWESIRDEFKSESSTSSSVRGTVEKVSKTTWSSALVDDDVVEIFSSHDDQRDRQGSRCDVPRSSGSVFTTGYPRPSSSASKGKGRERSDMGSSRTPGLRGRLIQTELDFGSKEVKKPSSGMTLSFNNADMSIEKTLFEKPSSNDVLTGTTKLPMWNCLVCTLENERGHLVCSACGTPKGQQTWTDI